MQNVDVREKKTGLNKKTKVNKEKHFKTIGKLKPTFFFRWEILDYSISFALNEYNHRHNWNILNSVPVLLNLQVILNLVSGISR